ncbi:Late Protein L2 [Chlamydia trachomatis]|nr:Late Protein L2 [Chlamydia trachomatis]
MVASRARRRKRASVTQLYSTCKAAGTCPPDVIPKVEGTTLADKILQWSGLGIFLGGLGIGTGSGTGGRTGYIPLGTGGRPSVVDIAPPRPPIVIDPVAPTEPSIVNLVEDASIIHSGSPIPTLSGAGGFDITSSSTTTPAVLDITPSTGTVHVTSTNITNPLYIEPPSIRPSQFGEVSGHIFTSGSTSGTHTYEEIPMEVFASNVTTSNDPISSTPTPGGGRLTAPRLYSKAYTQVKVTNSDFISKPSTFITYDNPAFEPVDTSITFQEPSNVAPDPAFLDIIKLHRPALTSRRGTVRFSRLGQKATLRTRSGKQIGARVHYYHDISNIAPADEVEMQPLNNDYSYDIYADLDEADTGFIEPPHTHTPISRSSVFSSLSKQLPYLSSSVSTSYANVTIPFSTHFNIPIHTGPDVVLPTSPTVWPYIPHTSIDTKHAIVIHGGDYYLWPYIYLLRKRRKRIPYFFTDGIVAH